MALFGYQELVEMRFLTIILLLLAVGFAFYVGSMIISERNEEAKAIELYGLTEPEISLFRGCQGLYRGTDFQAVRGKTEACSCVAKYLLKHLSDDDRKYATRMFLSAALKDVDERFIQLDKDISAYRNADNLSDHMLKSATQCFE